jgi:hypothetical protein
MGGGIILYKRQTPFRQEQIRTFLTGGNETKGDGEDREKEGSCYCIGILRWSLSLFSRRGFVVCALGLVHPVLVIPCPFLWVATHLAFIGPNSIQPYPLYASLMSGVGVPGNKALALPLINQGLFQYPIFTPLAVYFVCRRAV